MLIKACKVSTTLRNTGVDCDINMGPTAMIIAVPRTFSFGADEIASGFLDFIKGAIHGAAGARIFPIFGSNAPIRFITNNKEADVIATLDDGLQVFIRYGFLNRLFSTISGGLCYAKALQSFTASGYRILEIDKQNHLLSRDNKDGTYSGLRCDFMFAPSPDLPDFRNPWKTNFQVSFDPTEYVGNGTIFTLSDDESAIKDEMGLIDVSFELVSASTTHIIIDVKAECSEDNLVTILGSDLDVDDNWVVYNKDTGEVATTTVTVADGHVDIAGSFTSGATLIVKGESADVIYDEGDGIEGYDFAANPLEVVIP